MLPSTWWTSAGQPGYRETNIENSCLLSRQRRCNLQCDHAVWLYHLSEAVNKGFRSGNFYPSKFSARTTFTISHPPCSLRMVLSSLKPLPKTPALAAALRDCTLLSTSTTLGTAYSILPITEPLTSTSVWTHPPSLRSRSSLRAEHQVQMEE